MLEVSDMAPRVTVRRLQRETSAVLHEVEAGDPVVVTRDGEEIAKIVPLSVAERRWRRWVRDLGGNPDDQTWQRQPGSRPVATEQGRSLSDHLAAIRDGER